MAVWKELNPETGEYEVIPGASVGTGGNASAGGTTEGKLPDLAGKTAIFMGDSYTVGMSAVLQSMCAEFSLIADNRGKVSSTICGDTSGNKGFSPMWSRTRSVCEEYTTNGTTNNVALCVFMGGANDGFGLETWIGTGIADTDTDHIYGAMHSVLNSFRSTFPNAKLVVILQPSSYNRTVDSEVTDETAKIYGFADAASLLKLDDYQFSNYAMFVKEKAVQEVAEFYNASIVDCCFDWHSVLNANDRATYWSDDKLHLTASGNEDVAKKLRSKIIEIFSEKKQ